MFNYLSYFLVVDSSLPGFFKISLDILVFLTIASIVC